MNFSDESNFELQVHKIIEEIFWKNDTVKFVGANTFKFEFGFYTFYIGNREHK